ncbi:MAG TPA: acyl-CoA dehydrogenase family protein, partial [Enteractinococcus sp.]
MTITTPTAQNPNSADVLQAPPPLLPSPWYTEARQKLQDEAREFAQNEVLPIANELDPHKGEMPYSLIDRLGELGYFGITIPKDHGGLGLGVFEYCMVAEELARAWMSVGSILARAQGLGTNVADPERRQRLLRLSAEGKWVGAVGYSEPQAGSDLANVQTTAVRDGDSWVINGT